VRSQQLGFGGFPGRGQCRFHRAAHRPIYRLLEGGAKSSHSQPQAAHPKHECYAAGHKSQIVIIDPQQPKELRSFGHLAILELSFRSFRLPQVRVATQESPLRSSANEAESRQIVRSSRYRACVVNGQPQFVSRACCRSNDTQAAA
jgi:hypothetical protein